MTTLLGPIGGLIDLRCPSKLERPTGGVSYSWSQSVTGRRVNGQIVCTRRVWNLGHDIATPDNEATLEAFSYGGFGPGPFYFVSPDAVFTNLVTPWDSLMGSASHRLITPVPAGWTGAGALTLPDGTVVPGSLLRTDPAAADPLLVSAAIPASPFGKTMVRAWVQGDGATLNVRGADANGSQTGSWIPSTPSTAAGSWVTVAPDYSTSDTVFGVWIACSAATMVAGVQVTWTDDTMPYTPGRGCTSAVLDQWQTSAILAAPSARFDSGTYVITEVG